MKIDLKELTIAKIHQAYKKGTYTSEQLVKAYIDRIQKKDSSINAITFINPKAIETAKKLDNYLHLILVYLVYLVYLV